MFMTSHHFEGNAQALRIAAKLHDFKGSFVGLDLTVATLQYLLKYTRASHQPKTGAITHKKVGYFHAEGRPLPGHYQPNGGGQPTPSADLYPRSG